MQPTKEELLAELQALNLANSRMGPNLLQAAVKEKNPTWLVSEYRVRKVAVEAGLLIGVHPSKEELLSVSHFHRSFQQCFHRPSYWVDNLP